MLCYEQKNVAQKERFLVYQFLKVVSSDSQSGIFDPSYELALCLLEPVETFTVAGLSSLSFKWNPLRTSCVTIPALNCMDASREMASWTCIIRKHK
jgi:hypothetical protein